MKLKKIKQVRDYVMQALIDVGLDGKQAKRVIEKEDIHNFYNIIDVASYLDNPKAENLAIDEDFLLGVTDREFDKLHNGETPPLTLEQINKFEEAVALSKPTKLHEV